MTNECCIYFFDDKTVSNLNAYTNCIRETNYQLWQQINDATKCLVVCVKVNFKLNHMNGAHTNIKLIFKTTVIDNSSIAKHRQMLIKFQNDSNEREIGRTNTDDWVVNSVHMVGKMRKKKKEEKRWTNMAIKWKRVMIMICRIHLNDSWWKIESKNHFSVFFVVRSRFFCLLPPSFPSHPAISNVAMSVVKKIALTWVWRFIWCSFISFINDKIDNTECWRFGLR